MAELEQNDSEALVTTPDAPGGYPLAPGTYEGSYVSGGTSTEQQKRRALAGELREGEKAEADTTGAQEAIVKAPVKVVRSSSK